MRKEKLSEIERMRNDYEEARALRDQEFQSRIRTLKADFDRQILEQEAGGDWMQFLSGAIS